MTASGGDLVAHALEAHGVPFLFTLCGGHISPILVAAKQRGVRVIDVRHEATAVFAADAVARLTGAPGVAAVTAGPGVSNTITALKNARLAQSPVVLLGGGAPTVLKGRGALQDIDQRALVGPHVKHAFVVRRMRHLLPTLDRAFHAARSGVPGPVFVECPVDLLYPEATVREWYASSSGSRLLRWYLARHLNRQFAGPAGVAQPRPPAIATCSPRHVHRARRLLARAHRPVLLVGSQAMLDPTHAAELAEAVTRLEIPTYLSGMARGLLGAAHPLLLRHGRRHALRQADVVVLAGVPCDFRLDYGRHIAGAAAIVAVNRSHRDLHLNRRPTLPVRGDAGGFLRELAATGDAGSAWTSWCDTLRARDEGREAEIDAMARTPGDGVNPLALLRALDAAITGDSTIVLDGGDFAASASYVVRPRGPLQSLDPGVFGTLGVGAGFALGAKLARPDAPVWIVYGDGSAAFSLAEFDTFTRHGLPVIGLVGNDAGWTQIARAQREILDDDVGTVLHPTAYERVVEGYGGRGLRIEHQEDAAPVLDEAARIARSGQAVLVNASIGATPFRHGSIAM